MNNPRQIKIQPLPIIGVRSGRLTRAEVFIKSNENRGAIWRQVRGLYNSLKIKKENRKLKWPSGTPEQYEAELKRLRKMENKAVKKDKIKRVPKKILPNIPLLTGVLNVTNRRSNLYKKAKSLAKGRILSLTDKGSSEEYYEQIIKNITPKKEKWVKKKIILQKDRRLEEELKILRKIEKAKKLKKKPTIQLQKKIKIIENEIKKHKVTPVFDYVKILRPPRDIAELNDMIDDIDRNILRLHNAKDFFTIKFVGESESLHFEEAKFTRLKNSQADNMTIAKKKDQFKFLREWASQFTNSGGILMDLDYSMIIDKITVRIIPANAGGCEMKRDKIMEISDMKLKALRSKNNNCLFAAIKNHINLKNNKINKRPCNAMRQEFNIDKDLPITPEDAIKIFKKYRKCSKYQLQIVDSITMEQYTTEKYDNNKDSLFLWLMENHYYIVECDNYDYKRCPNKECGKMIRDLESHLKNCRVNKYDQCKTCGHHHNTDKNCNPKHVSYWQTKVKGNNNRFVIDRYNNNEKLEVMNIIHYDMETHARGNNKQHECVIIGYTDIDENIDMDMKNQNKLNEAYDNERDNTKELTSRKESLSAIVSHGSDNFKYIAGKECVKQFIARIIAMADKIINNGLKQVKDDMKKNKKKWGGKKCHKSEEDCIKYLQNQPSNALYLDAYNGSGFDHYILVNTMLSMGLQFRNFCIASGSLIRAHYKNIVLIDLMKYTAGSLRNNLIEINCDVKKGEFDYRKLDVWDKMNKEDQKECIAYLKSDVMGLRELYNKLNIELYDKFKNNLAKFYSTSHTTFTMWIHQVISEAPKEEKGSIIIPTLRQEKVFRPSVYGGRCYKSRNQFISSQRDQIIGGKIKFNEVNDYIIDEDVVSLYPSAMEKYEFPIDIPVELNAFNSEDITTWNEYMAKHKKTQHMAIFYIKYITNKYLAHAILPSRTKEGLRWTLKDGEGYYTSVDIETALLYGYKIEMIENPIDNIIGYYWKKSRKIFKSYINKLYQFKKQAEKGTPQYKLAKLFMNGLYGKCIQRPIDTKSAWLSSTADFWGFYNKYIVTNVEYINNQFYVSGYERDEDKREKAITKPTHLGAFILSYSRRIMLEYMNVSNPYFDIKNRPDLRKAQMMNDFCYTDTDAIQIHNKNYIPESKELGGITNDLGDGCKIISGIWIAPKLYMLEYITRDSWNIMSKKEIEDVRLGALIRQEGSIKLYYHLRGKGVPKGYFNDDGKYERQLSYEIFKKMGRGESIKTDRGFAIRKINTKKNSKQTHLDYFGVFTLDKADTVRTLNKHLWNGRQFIGNYSIPLK